jgi:ATP-dependent DNA helicase DinG
LSATAFGLTVVLVGDVPLKSRVAAILAADFGSRVQVEKTCLDDNGILVSGWEFWRSHQSVLPAPQLLIIATLPLPSLENPLVAGRVAYYKRSHQDWFRLYLLPTALSELQRALAPVRESQGVVALLDSRVVNRSYGSQILASLSPRARLDYLDPSLFSHTPENY